MLNVETVYRNISAWNPGLMLFFLVFEAEIIEEIDDFNRDVVVLVCTNSIAQILYVFIPYIIVICFGLVFPNYVDKASRSKLPRIRGVNVKDVVVLMLQF